MSSATLICCSLARRCSICHAVDVTQEIQITGEQINQLHEMLVD